MKIEFQTTVAALFVTVMMSSAHATVIGTADSEGCIPFGCTTGGTTYQQVYASTSFSAPINIGEISFFNSVLPGGAPMTGTFNIWLSTTNEPIATFDTSFVAFPPSTFTKVFQGTLPAVSGGEMDFFLQSPFLYNPSQGNLMLTVQTFNGAAVGTDSSKWLYLDVDRNAGLTNSRISAFSIDWNQGLVTGFSAVPGPVVGAGLPGLIAACTGLVALARRRRQRSAF